MEHLTYFTDGGCQPNPGNGTWAFICTNPYIEISGSQSDTTNNRMELTAIVSAIKHGLEMKADKITIYTDSEYCQMSFMFWMENWAKKNFARKKNSDIFKELLEIKKSNPNKITVQWVRGHDGNEFNEQCDQLVRDEYEKSFGGQMQY
jgi:ribonuclease HI